MTPILILLSGLILLICASGLKKLGVPEWVSMLTFMILFNLIIARWVGLVSELKASWCIKRAYLIIVGFLLGAAPLVIAKYHDLSIAHFSWMGALVTLAIVSWEELWFRGVVLEYAALQYTRIGASVVFGSVFALLHILNPNVHLLSDGPGLFLAGYTLSVCYFVFKTIWAPIGMHFANNLIENALGISVEPKTLNYIIPLFLIATLLTWRIFLSRSVRQKPYRL
jgi:membrane protease YdiL (CAAX protease family)